MCWDQQTSIITFILGTVFNLFIIFYFRETIITLLAIIWEWFLLMQVFEAIAWGSQPNSGDSPGECSGKNKIAAKGAIVSALAQPILIAFLLIVFTPVSVQNKIMAMVVVFAYICWSIYVLNQSPPFECLIPNKDCPHLQLDWWDNFTGGVIPYIITIIVVVILLLRPMDMAWFLIIAVGIVALLSKIFYSCGAGSIWCWFVVFAPVVTGLYWYYTRGPPKI